MFVWLLAGEEKTDCGNHSISHSRGVVNIMVSYDADVTIGYCLMCKLVC